MNPESDHSHSDDHGPEWYADGLRFTCTQCGHCCSGPAGYVWVSDEEIECLARSLDLSTTEFRNRYTRQVHGRTSLIERRTDFGLDCVFLSRNDPDGRALCTVYTDRPHQCRTYPFWPENLHSPRDWKRTGRTCPGLNTGRLVPIEEIRVRRDGQSLSDGA